jgi:Tol biopolymer transport system component
VADTNGAHEQFILSHAAGPSWSPGGQTIYFFGEDGINLQESNGIKVPFSDISSGLVALNASPLPTGIDQIKLTQRGDWKQGSARWTSVSPDGQLIAYDARPGGDYRIYFFPTDPNQRFSVEIPGEQAEWSPDGQKIVYRSGRSGKTGVWISNRDDSEPTNLTNNGGDAFPAWSPDGKKIAFSRDEGNNIDVYTINVDGSDLRRLTEAPGPDTLPIFTPTGDIIFRSARNGGNWGVWKMNGNGANQKEIIPFAGVGPDWPSSRMDVVK